MLLRVLQIAFVNAVENDEQAKITLTTQPRFELFNSLIMGFVKLET